MKSLVTLPTGRQVYGLDYYAANQPAGRQGQGY
jgi:hypothetical protein